MVKKVKRVTIKKDDSESEENEPVETGEKTLTFSGALGGDDYGDEGGSGDDGSDGEDFDDFDKNSGGNNSGPEMFSDEEGVSVHDLEEEKPLSAEQLEERKKAKRIEKLEKRIKLLQKKKDKKGPQRTKFEKEASEIKNKHKRQEVVVRRKMAANAENKLKQLQTKKLREELGEEAVPKGKNATIESMRVPDETMMDDNEDEDILGEQNIDEFDKYFNRETTPKILVTTNRRPKGDIFGFLKELKITIPNIEYYPR
jgi:hypothetical protein